MSGPHEWFEGDAAWDDEEEEGMDQLEQDLLRRCSSRLSEVLPKRLRFSTSAALAGRQPVACLPLTQPLKVFVRIRPSTVQQPVAACSSEGVQAAQGSCCITAPSTTHLHVQPPVKRGVRAAPGEQYSFSQVFPADSTQQQLYDASTANLVSDLLHFKVKSSVVMAYGSSGAGKTFSIEGPAAEPGLLPRALQQVMQAVTPGQVEVSISCYEVYGDAVYDLLAPATAAAPGPSGPHPAPHRNPAGLPPRPPGGPVAKPPAAPRLPRHALLQPQEPVRRALRVREDAGGQVAVPGLTRLVVTDAAQAAEVQRAAARCRQQASTRLNSASSRSHCVFTLYVRELHGQGGEGQGPGPACSIPATASAAAPAAAACGRECSLSFVDLAGSERVARTGNQGERFKESVSINSSLMTLGRCMDVLRANQQIQQQHAAAGAAGGGKGGLRRVPYRESKLTHLFRDVLLGEGVLVLLVVVSPSSDDYEETAHVLRYAAAATGITLTVLPPPLPPAAPAATASKPAQPALLPAADAALPAAQQEEPGSDEDTTMADVSSNAACATRTAAAAAGGSRPADEVVAGLRARVAELECELHNTTVQLHDSQAALEEVEADIREDVVAEIANVVRSLRDTYDAQLADMAAQLRALQDDLAAKDLLIQQLTAAAGTAAAPEQPGSGAAGAHHQGVGAPQDPGSGSAHEPGTAHHHGGERGGTAAQPVVPASCQWQPVQEHQPTPQQQQQQQRLAAVTLALPNPTAETQAELAPAHSSLPQCAQLCNGLPDATAAQGAALQGAPREPATAAAAADTQLGGGRRGRTHAAGHDGDATKPAQDQPLVQVSQEELLQHADGLGPEQNAAGHAAAAAAAGARPGSGAVDMQLASGPTVQEDMAAVPQQVAQGATKGPMDAPAAAEVPAADCGAACVVADAQAPPAGKQRQQRAPGSRKRARQEAPSTSQGTLPLQLQEEEQQGDGAAEVEQPALRRSRRTRCG